MKPGLILDQNSVSRGIINICMFLLVLMLTGVFPTNAQEDPQLKNKTVTIPNVLSSSESQNEENKEDCNSSHCNPSCSPSLNGSCPCPDGYYWTEGRCAEILPVPPDISLLFTTTRPGSIQKLYTLNHQTYTSVVVPGSQLKSDIVALAMHNNVVYFCDKFLHHITAQHINETNPTSLLQGISRCSGLAVDDYNIYWSDQKKGSISVARLDTPSIKKVIHQEFSSEPTDLVWSSSSGQLYFFQKDQDDKRLLCQLSPDGTKFGVLYTWNDAPYPSSLAVKDDNLFWWEGSTLMSMNLEDFNKTVVFTLPQILEPSLPQSLAALSNGSFAWSDDDDLHLAFRDDLQERMVFSKIKSTIPNPHLVLEYPFNPILDEHVPKTECEQLYLPSPSGVRECACIKDFSRDPQNLTACIPKLKDCYEKDEYRCADGKCIPLSSFCNGIQDCPTENEELNCSACSENEFMCTSRHCISMNKKCDGIKDCTDGTDELNCGNSTFDCDFPSHSCDNSTKCIPASRFCDGVQDCEDETDEPGNCHELREQCNCQDICYLTREGPACNCKKGRKLKSDGKTCEGSQEDVCQAWGTCSQFCQKEDSNYRCYCAPNFNLRKDDFSCDSTDEREPLVLVSTGSKLIKYNLNSRSHTIFKSPGLERVGYINFYISPFNKEEFPSIFWCSMENQQILTSRMTPSGELGPPSLVVEGSLPKLDGLAVDWLNQRIYWLDSMLRNIEMSHFDGSLRTSILSSGLVEPHGLALDPHEHFLFWIEKSPKSGIDRSDISGQNHQRILTKGLPTGLTLDYITKYIYWVDLESQTVNVVDYYGKNSRQVRTTSWLFHPFSVALYGNHVLWTDQNHRTLSMGSRWTDDKIEILLVEYPYIFDVQVVHSSRQPTNELEILFNPCADNNGGCSHLCFPTPEKSPSSKVCGCPYGYELEPDLHTCRVPYSSLSMITKHSILYVTIYNSSHLLLPPLHLKKEIAEAKPFVDDKYIFYVQDQNIYKKNIITKKRELIITLAPRFRPISVVNGPNHIVYILVRGIENYHGYIAACNHKGEHLTTLVGAHFPHPLAFTVDQVSGQIFWAHGHHSNHTGDHYIITTCSPTGRDCKELLSSIRTSGMGKPVRLEIFSHSHLLYWLSTNGTLSSVNYNTRKVRLNFEHNVESFAIVASGDLVYKKVKDPTVYIWKASQELSLPLYKREDSSKVEFLPSSGTRKKIIEHCHGGCGLCIHFNKCIGHRGQAYVMYVQGGSPKALTDGHEVLPSLNTDSPLSLVHFHRTRPLMFWTDSSHALHKSHTEGRGHLQLIPPRPSHPILSVAVDWQSDNLYWISHDGRYSRIHVSRMDGKHPYIIYQTEGVISNLAVDPVNGYTYWASIDKTIQQASLAGDDPHTLINLHLPLGELVVDPQTLDLYWTSPFVGRIEKVHPDGTGHTVIASGLGVGLDSMDISPKGILWVDGGSSQREGASILFSDKHGHNRSVVASGLGQKVSLVRWHGYSNRKIWDNPCSQGDNGGCQHLCFYHGKPNTSYDCECSHKQLGPDGYSCETSTNYLLMAYQKRLRSYKLANPFDPNLPLPKWSFPDDSLSFITLDSQNHILYYADLNAPYLFMLSLENGTNSPVLPNLHEITGIQRVEGLALDSIRNELYWLDGAYPSIWKINLASPHPIQVLKLDPHDVPRSLALDACNQLLFWSSWKLVEPSIQVSRLSGEDRRVLIQDDVHEPSSLFLHQGDLYWLDNIDDVSSINSISIFGGIKIVHFQHFKETKATSLAIHSSGMMFWTDAIREALYVKGFPGDPTSIHIIDAIGSHPAILSIYEDNSTTCQGKYKCVNPCLNGGVCAALNDSAPPQCLCPRDFAGLSCETPVNLADYMVIAAIIVTALVFFFLLLVSCFALRKKKLSLRASFGSWIKNVSRLLHLRQKYLAKDSRMDHRTYVEYYNLSNPLIEDGETGPLYHNDAKLFFLNHPSGTASRQQGGDIL